MNTTLPTARVNDTTDTGRVRTGAAHRLLSPVLPYAVVPGVAVPNSGVPAQDKDIADNGRVRVGAAHRLLAAASRT